MIYTWLLFAIKLHIYVLVFALRLYVCPDYVQNDWTVKAFGWF